MLRFGVFLLTKDNKYDNIKNQKINLFFLTTKGRKLMGVDPVNPLDGAKKPEKGKVNKLPEAGSKSFQDELRLRLLIDSIDSIKSKMIEGETEAALSSFKTIFTPVGGAFDLARKIFEGAPVFAAFVAKMAIDEIMAKLDLEKEKARELWQLAEEYTQGSKRVPPI